VDFIILLSPKTGRALQSAGSSGVYVKMMNRAFGSASCVASEAVNGVYCA
jgi:hypothetical protein